jgi:hypothetical protein
MRRRFPLVTDENLLKLGQFGEPDCADGGLVPANVQLALARQDEKNAARHRECRTIWEARMDGSRGVCQYESGNRRCRPVALEVVQEFRPVMFQRVLSK